MKHLVLLFLSVSICLIACNKKEDIQVLDNTMEAVTVQGKKASDPQLQLVLNPFMDLVRAKAHPFDKLSQQAVSHFNKSLIFNAENEIISGNYSEVEDELTKEEFQTFFETIFHKEVKFLDKGESAPLVDNTLERQDCCLIYVKRHKQWRSITQSCEPKPRSFCVICSACND